MSLWSAWLSTQKKESTESGKNMGKGMWDGGEGEEGAAQSAPGPPRSVHSDTVSSCLGEGKQIGGHLSHQSRSLLPQVSRTLSR